MSSPGLLPRGRPFRQLDCHYGEQENENDEEERQRSGPPWHTCHEGAWIGWAHIGMLGLSQLLPNISPENNGGLGGLRQGYPNWKELINNLPCGYVVHKWGRQF